MALSDRIEAAKAEVARLERQALTASCAEVDHDWKSIGGKNAGCSDTCGCPVPVNVCQRCEDCDYGDNPEAHKTISNCALKKEQ